MTFCVEDSSIELLLFWLDVEHFKYFDGDEEDTKLFGHHISECHILLMDFFEVWNS